MGVNLVRFVDYHDVQKNKCFDTQCIIIYIIICKFKSSVPTYIGYITYIRYNSI